MRSTISARYPARASSGTPDRAEVDLPASAARRARSRDRRSPRCAACARTAATRTAARPTRPPARRRARGAARSSRGWRVAPRALARMTAAAAMRVPRRAGASPNSRHVAAASPAREAEHSPVDAQRQRDLRCRWFRAPPRAPAPSFPASSSASAVPIGHEHEALGQQLPHDPRRARRRGRAGPPSRARARWRGPAAGWRGSRRRPRARSPAMASRSHKRRCRTPRAAGDSPPPPGRAASVNFRYLSTLTGGYAAGSDARNSAGDAAASCAEARSGVQPGLSRPNTLSHHVVPAFDPALAVGAERRLRAERHATSNDAADLEPVEPRRRRRRRSPRASPFSVIVRPTADGSPP